MPTLSYHDKLERVAKATERIAESLEELVLQGKPARVSPLHKKTAPLFPYEDAVGAVVGRLIADLDSAAVDV